MSGMRNKRKVTIIVLAIVGLLLIGAVVFALNMGGEQEAGPDGPIYRSQLTGEEVDQEVSERPILGAMFNNSTEARPQTGLDAAGIVFETTTEGGITRYLALYQEDIPDEIGPIRSLRQYFLDWMMGFDASVAHVGGSAKALDLVEQRDAKSLNQFTHEEPYYRTNDRPSPHNMYVRTQGLRDLQQELGHEQSQFDEIPRKSDSASENPEAETINIDYSGPDYRVEFRYDASTNNYTRYLAGQPHTDAATNQPITVKNMIVIKTARNADAGKAIGDGDALVFMDGSVVEATWEKSSPDERIKILDDEGNEVPLNRGDTWFAVTPSDRRITY